MILQHNPLYEYKWERVELRGRMFGHNCHFLMDNGWYQYAMGWLKWEKYFDGHIVAICHDCETVYYTNELF